MFEFHDGFFILMFIIINHSHNRSVETRTYCFQTFFSLKVNFNAIHCRESNSVTSFQFSSRIPLVDQSQKNYMFFSCLYGLNFQKNTSNTWLVKFKFCLKMGRPVCKYHEICLYYV